MMPDAESPFAATNSREEMDAFLGLQQHEFITYRISVLSRIFDRLADRRMLKRRGLSLTDSRVLGHLYVSRQATVRGLANEMHMHRPQISRAMSALVRQGYARKKSDPKDLRSAVFTITAKGNRFYAEIMATGHDRQYALAGILGLDGYTKLNEQLARLIATFGPQDQQQTD